MLKHKAEINLSRFSIKTPTFEAPGVPRNLEGSTDITSNDVNLKWDPPNSGGPVRYYEIFKNGSLVGHSNSTDFSYSGPTSGDIFKVRSVGGNKLKSGFSNTWTYQGSETLVLSIVAYSSSLHVRWNDISNSEQITFEGYNVYLDGVKQNGSLLGEAVLAYPFFNLTSGTTYTVGVSFEYDGGQESSIFTIDETVGAQGTIYQVSITGAYRSYPIVGLTGSIFDKEGGVIVAEDSDITVTPLFSAGDQNDHPEWMSPISTRNRRYLLRTIGGNIQSAEMEFNSGCGNSSNILIRNNFETLHTSTNEYAQLYGSITHDWNFVVSGAQCGDPKRESLAFQVGVASSDFLRVGGYSNSNFKTFKLPTEDEASRLKAAPDTSGNVVMTWASYYSLTYLKIYIKGKADASYPSSSHHSGYLLNADNNYEITDLADGDYNAKIEYYLADQSTLILTSSEIGFTISGN